MSSLGAGTVLMSVRSAPGTQIDASGFRSGDWQPYFGTGKEEQILCLVLPCEYCMPQIIHFWYLHIYYSVLCSDDIYYGTKSHRKMAPLYDELTIQTSSPLDPRVFTDGSSFWWSSDSWLQSNFIKSMRVILENFADVMQSHGRWGLCYIKWGETADQNDDISASEGNGLCIRRLRGLGKTGGGLRYFVKVPFLW